MTLTPLSRSKGQGHQAALVTAALTREAGAAVTVRTYWAWETTATLRLLGGALGAHGGGEGRGISCRHAHSLIFFVFLRGEMYSNKLFDVGADRDVEIS